MSLAGHTAFANSLGIEMDISPKDWDDLSTSVKDAWYDSARAMYATIAICAGAKVTEVKDPNL